VSVCMGGEPDKYKQCKQQCRTDYSAITHNKYYRNLEKYCYSDDLDYSKMTAVITQPSVSCNEACAARSMICQLRFMNAINSCSVMRQISPHCAKCTNEKDSYAPSIIINDTNTEKEPSPTHTEEKQLPFSVVKDYKLGENAAEHYTCITTDEMYFNCDNRKHNYIRLCPCT